MPDIQSKPSNLTDALDTISTLISAGKGDKNAKQRLNSKTAKTVKTPSLGFSMSDPLAGINVQEELGRSKRGVERAFLKDTSPAPMKHVGDWGTVQTPESGFSMTPSLGFADQQIEKPGRGKASRIKPSDPFNGGRPEMEFLKPEFRDQGSQTSYKQKDPTTLQGVMARFDILDKGALTNGVNPSEARLKFQKQAQRIMESGNWSEEMAHEMLASQFGGNIRARLARFGFGTNSNFDVKPPSPILRDEGAKDFSLFAVPGKLTEGVVDTVISGYMGLDPNNVEDQKTLEDVKSSEAGRLVYGLSELGSYMTMPGKLATGIMGGGAMEGISQISPEKIRQNPVGSATSVLGNIPQIAPIAGIINKVYDPKTRSVDMSKADWVDYTLGVVGMAAVVYPHVRNRSGQKPIEGETNPQSEAFRDVLGIGKKATLEDAEAAYKNLARQYHPDVNPDPSAHDRMAQLNEAIGEARLYDWARQSGYDHRSASDLIDQIRNTIKLAGDKTVEGFRKLQGFITSGATSKLRDFIGKTVKRVADSGDQSDTNNPLALTGKTSPASKQGGNQPSLPPARPVMEIAQDLGADGETIITQEEGKQDLEAISKLVKSGEYEAETQPDGSLRVFRAPFNAQNQSTDSQDQPNYSNAVVVPHPETSGVFAVEKAPGQYVTDTEGPYKGGVTHFGTAEGAQHHIDSWKAHEQNAIQSESNSSQTPIDEVIDLDEDGDPREMSVVEGGKTIYSGADVKKAQQVFLDAYERNKNESGQTVTLWDGNEPFNDPSDIGLPSPLPIGDSQPSKFKGIPISKPIKELTDEEFEKIVAPDPAIMSKRNAEMASYQGDKRFHVLVPGESSAVQTDWNAVRRYAKTGKLPDIPDGSPVKQLSGGSRPNRDYFDQGREAAIAGHSIRENPYLLSSDASDNWIRGWDFLKAPGGVDNYNAEKIWKGLTPAGKRAMLEAVSLAKNKVAPTSRRYWQNLDPKLQKRLSNLVKKGWTGEDEAPVSNSPKYVEVGKNPAGDTLKADGHGVRHYVKNGIRHTEPVLISVGGSGTLTLPVRGMSPYEPLGEFNTVEEHASHNATRGSVSQGSESKEPWQQWRDWRNAEPPTRPDSKTATNEDALKWLEADAADKSRGTQVARQVLADPSNWHNLTRDELLGAHAQVNSLDRVMFGRDTAELHKNAVSQALSEGKPVPPEVLADYPDLAQKQNNRDNKAVSHELPNDLRQKLIDKFTRYYASHVEGRDGSDFLNTAKQLADVVITGKDPHGLLSNSEYSKLAEQGRALALSEGYKHDHEYSAEHASPDVDDEHLDRILQVTQTEGIEPEKLDADRDAWRKMTSEQRAKAVEIYKQVAGAHQEFIDLVHEIADTTGGKAIIGPIKRLARTVRKADSDYEGDLGKVRDVLRATIEAKDLDLALEIGSQIKDKLKVPDERFKDRINSPTPAGYMDILANGRLTDGMTVEIQVNVPEMLEAKSKAHSYYAEEVQAWDVYDKAIENGHDEAAEKAKEIAEKFLAKQREIYLPVQESLIASRNSASEQTHSGAGNPESRGDIAPPQQQKTPLPGTETQGEPSRTANRAPEGNDSGIGNLSDISGASNNNYTPKLTESQGEIAGSSPLSEKSFSEDSLSAISSDPDVAEALALLKAAMEDGSLQRPAPKNQRRPEGLAMPSSAPKMAGVDPKIADAMWKVATALYDKGVADPDALAETMSKVAGTTGAMFVHAFHGKIAEGSSERAQELSKLKDNKTNDNTRSQGEPILGKSGKQSSEAPSQTSQRTEADGGAGAGVLPDGSREPGREPVLKDDQTAGNTRPSGGSREQSDTLPSNGVRPSGNGEISSEAGSGERGRSDFRLDEVYANGRKPIIAPTNAGKAKDLVNAIKALRLAKERGNATPSEQEALIRFPGWGFDGSWLKPGTKNADSATGKELWSLLDNDQRISAIVATRNSHYTSPEVVSQIWSALRHLGFNGADHEILEPSAGTGLFYAAMPEDLRGGKWTMVELEPTTAEVSKLLYPEQTVINSGYQKVKIPDGKFPLVVSNVPFDAPIADPSFFERFDSQTAEALTARSHNYFFAKAVLNTRPGGIIAFVTSKGTMDNTQDAVAVREWLSKETELLGAVRLPNTAFSASANTEVVTDVIFLRRRGHDAPPIENDWIKTVPIKIGDLKYNINEYFKNNPQMVLGKNAMSGSMRKANEYTVEPKEHKSLASQIADAIKRLPEGTFAPVSDWVEPESNSIPIPIGTKLGEVWSDGDKILKLTPGGNVIELTDKELGRGGEQGAGKVARNRKVFQSYFKVKEALSQVMAMQGAEPDDLAAAQAKLAKAYESFKKSHGEFHKNTVVEKPMRDDDGKPVVDEDGQPLMDVNVRFIYKPLLWQDSQAVRVFALEVWDTDELKVGKLSDVFTKRTVTLDQQIKNVETAEDALNASLNINGKVDLGWMAGVYGKAIDEITNELGDKLYKTPLGDYEDSESYLSGNVRQKLVEAKRALEEGKEEFRRNVEALQRIQPEDTPYEEIYAPMGAAWMPKDVIQDFVHDLVGRREHWSKENAYHIENVNGRWHVESNVKGNSAKESEWGGDLDFKTILKAALNGTPVKVTEKINDKEVINQAKTDAANERVSAVQSQFTAWLDNNGSHQQTVARMYNDAVNVFRPKLFNGSSLTFPGLSPAIELRKHRVSAVSRAMRDKFTLWWHGVGSGKTFTGMMLSMKLKQTGLRNKPIFVCYKPTLEQIIADSYKAYPNGNFLAAHEDSFTKGNREEFLSLMATGDWDAVFITQEQFKALPLSPDATHRLYDQLVDNEMVNSGFEVNTPRSEIEKASGSKDIKTKELARRILKLMTARDKAVDLSEKSTSGLTFDSMGIDHMVVDEAHMYKGLEFTTAHTSLGLSVSARALDLWAKLEYLRGEKVKGGATLMTGTAIVNSGAEVYNLMRMLDPMALASMGVSDFDAFASVFIRFGSEIESSVSGVFKQKERIRAFYNIGHLAALFSQVADVVPTSAVSEIKLPELRDLQGNVTGKPILVLTQPTPFQTDAFLDIMNRFKIVKEKIGRGEMPGKGEDNYLSLSTAARLASQDARFYDPTLPAEAGSKAEAVAKNVADIYHKYASDKATQIVYIDLGVPTDDGKKSGRFDAYADMIDRLVALGVKRSEIASITDAKNATQRTMIAGKMRSGSVRVLLGSRPKIGVGMNIQDKLIAWHHVALGWNPAMVEQGDGRGIRFGNEWTEKGGVMKFIYINQASYDQVTANATMAKGNVIDQFMRAMAGYGAEVKELEDLAQEEGTNSMAEVAAVATGDTRILELVRSSKELAKAIAVVSMHARKQDSALARARHYKTLADNEQVALTKQIEIANALISKNATGDKLAIEVKGGTPEKVKDATKKLYEMADKAYGIETIGTFGDLNVIARVKDSGFGYYAQSIDLQLPNYGGYVNIDYFKAGETKTWSSNINQLARAAVSEAIKAPQLTEANIARYLSEARDHEELSKQDIPKEAIQKVYDIEKSLKELEFQTGTTIHALESGEETGFGRSKTSAVDVKESAEIRLRDAETRKFTGEVEPVTVVGVNSLDWVLYKSENGNLHIASPSSAEWMDVAKPVRQALTSDGDRLLETKIQEEQRPSEPESLDRRKGRPGYSRSTYPPNRISVSPISSSGTKRLDQIVLDLRKAFGGQQVTGSSQKGTLGQYLPKSKTRFVRGTTDLDTLSHEVAHALDDRYDILGEYKGSITTPYDGELFKPEFTSTMDPSMPLWQQRAEGFAEFVRAWIVNPDEAEALAPGLTKLLRDKASKIQVKVNGRVVKHDALGAIREFGDDIRRFAGASPVEQAAASVAMDDDPVKDGVMNWVRKQLSRTNELGEYKTSFADVYRLMFTDFYGPAMSAFKESFARTGLDAVDQPEGLKPSENPVVLLRRIPYADQAVAAGIRHGLADLNGAVTTGPVLDIFKDFDRSSKEAFQKDERDLAVFMFSQRQLHEQAKEHQRSRESFAIFAAKVADVASRRLDEVRERIAKDASARLDSAKFGIAEAANVALKKADQNGSPQSVSEDILKKAYALDAKAEKVFRRWQSRQEAKAKKKIDEWLNKKLASADAYYKAKAERNSKTKILSSGGNIIDPNMTARKALAELKKNPERYAMFERAATRYREVGDWGLRFLNDAGVLSDESMITIRDQNPYWVSAMRGDMDVRGVVGTARSVSSHKKIVQTFKGSERVLRNPFDSLLETVHSVLNEGWRNDTMRAWTDILSTDRSMYEPGKPDNSDLAFKLPQGAQVPKGKAEHVFTVMRNGEPEQWFVPDDTLAWVLKNGLTGIKSPHPFLDSLINLASLPASILRNTITRMPAFALRNFSRDTKQRWVGTLHSSPYWGSYVLPKSGDYEMYDRYGLGLANLEQIEGRKGWDKARRRIESDMVGAKDPIAIVLKWAGHIPNWYESLLEAAEKQNRLAEFRAAFKKAKGDGMEDNDAALYAAHEARMLMIDFRRAGIVSKFINRFVPFFNAGMQGQSSFWNQTSRDPWKIGRKMLIYAVIGIALERMFAQLTESNDDLSAIDPMRRDLYWNFKIGDDMWLTIPKGHEAGLLVSLASRIIDQVTGQDQHALDNEFARLMRVMSPADDSDLMGPLKTWWEVKSNYDSFRDKDIVPMWEADKSLDLRKGQKYASPIGKALHGVGGLDARQWDYVFNSAFGNLGATAIDTSKMSIGQEPVYQWGSKLSGIFNVSSMYGNRDVQWITRTCKENGIGKPVIKPLLENYWNAKTPAERDAAAREATNAARDLRLEAEEAAKGLSGREKADAYRSVLSGATKDGGQRYESIADPEENDDDSSDN